MKAIKCDICGRFVENEVIDYHSDNTACIAHFGYTPIGYVKGESYQLDCCGKCAKEMFAVLCDFINSKNQKGNNENGN